MVTDRRGFYLPQQFGESLNYVDGEEDKAIARLRDLAERFYEQHRSLVEDMGIQRYQLRAREVEGVKMMGWYCANIEGFEREDPCGAWASKGVYMFKRARILSLSLAFAEMHGGDGDCIGRMARELYDLIKAEYPITDGNDVRDEYDC